MNLTRFERDGLELVIDTVTGEAFASVRGYARMSSKPESTIRDRSKGVRKDEVLEAEIPTQGGIQSARLLTEDIITDWIVEDNPTLAKAMLKAGVRVFLHTAAGYKLTSEAIAPATPQPQPVTAGITPAKLDLLRSAMSSVPVPLVDGFILNRVQYHYPELKADINAAHGLLAATNPIPEVLLTPTAIGDRLGISARVVNALLTENGYQVKNHGKSKSEPAYLPTELGDRFSSNTLATGKGKDNTSYQHMKWQESIVEVLRGLM